LKEPARSAAPFEVVAVRYATLETTRSALFAEYQRYGEPDRPMRMDYFFWIVRNEERLILVDTGFQPEVGARKGREVFCRPHEALHRLGLSGAAVSDLVLTHFHYDHIGNVATFPGARIITSTREFAFWTGPDAEFTEDTPVEPDEVAVVVAARLDGRVTLLPEEPAGIPGLDIAEVAGHTPGQLVVTAATAEGVVVLASDAAHFYEEYRRDMPFHVYSDLPAMRQGFRTLRSLTDRPGTVVVPGHDPEVMHNFPPVSLNTAGLAVRLG